MEGEIQSLLVSMNAIFGVTFNSFLLYLIATDPKKDGHYKRMLAIVSLYNVYYAMVHFVVDVGFLIDDAGFLMFSKRFHPYGYWPSYLGVQLYVNAFTMSITLLAIHCLYRFVKISGKWSYLFTKWYWLLLIAFLQFLFGIGWSLFCHFSMSPSPERNALSKEELMHKYNTSIEGLGYIGPVYKWTKNGTTTYLWRNMTGSAGCMGILVVACMVITCGGLRLYFFIRNSMSSDATRRMHYQLLRVLLAQAISPLIFEYIPCISTVWGGFIWAPWRNVDMFVPVFISSYSGADAIMIIAFFKEYRNRTYRILTSPFHKFSKPDPRVGSISKPSTSVFRITITN